MSRTVKDKFIAIHSSDGAYPGGRGRRDFVVAYAVKGDGSLDGTWAGKGGSKLGTEKLTGK